MILDDFANSSCKKLCFLKVMFVYVFSLLKAENWAVGFENINNVWLHPTKIWDEKFDYYNYTFDNFGLKR